MNFATADRPVERGFGSLICSPIKIAALVVLCASAHGQTVLDVDDDASVWANVDHATEFGIGTLLSSCQADCAEPSGVVGPTDLVAVISAWGDAVAGEPADVNADRMVNIDDVLYVVAHWGACQ